jgi:signal transduction histidine kinase
MKELSLHLLDLIENSVAAGATHVDIVVEEDVTNDRLRITVTDDGEGMPAELAQAAADPFTTTRTTRSVGMGLALLAGAVAQAAGSLEVTSKPGQGTTIAADFQLSNIDRAPLGRVEDTLSAAAAVHPELHLSYLHRGPGGCYEVNLPGLTQDGSQARLRREIARLVHEGRQQIGSTA